MKKDIYDSIIIGGGFTGFILLILLPLRARESCCASTKTHA